VPPPTISPVEIKSFTGALFWAYPPNLAGRVTVAAQGIAPQSEPAVDRPGRREQRLRSEEVEEENDRLGDVQMAVVVRIRRRAAGGSGGAQVAGEDRFQGIAEVMEGPAGSFSSR
jgi:hypothetical protein